jgi:methylglutaconyl-CoA hydratase
MTELVLYEVRSPAAIVTLNRPDRRNALSRALIDALGLAFERARDEPGVRCVILTGAGSVFCAGMDLAELAESVNQLQGTRVGQDSNPVSVSQQAPAADTIWHDALRLARVYDLIYTLPRPTIAAINGTAVAGGAGLVTVCDLAMAVPEAHFGYPEVRRGLVAAMVMPHLLRHVGERMARFLLLTGEMISATEAHRTGLVNELVPGPQLLDRALACAREIAEGGPNALAHTKQLLQRFSRQALSIEEAAQASAAPRLTAECQDGLRAFFDKRPVPWKAKW